jgi:hypothetical protein
MAEAPDPPAPAPTSDAPAPNPPTSKVGKLIVRFPQIIPSTVIGVAGLVATQLWQCRQSDIAKRQAVAQQQIAQTQADNNWKIARADILAKNLAVLASSGAANAGERYGVLLSLARGKIIDPELAVAYALELGRDNPEDMASVLANTSGKDYGRLLRAFTLSCEARFGVSPPVDACVGDKLIARSAALGLLVADELAGPDLEDPPGPIGLLRDERFVQRNLAPLTAMFTDGLLGFYGRRQWDELAAFQAATPGAHLVSALVLAASRTGEFVTDDEAHKLDEFHGAQTAWLDAYLAGKTCDAECKGALVEVMVSHFAESQGDYDAALRSLLESPRAVSASAISHLHARLLWCQVGEEDLAPLRDHVLVPTAKALLDKPPKDLAIRDAVLSLIALTPEPAAADPGAAAWTALLAQLDKAGDKLAKAFRDRRAASERQRQKPPAAMRQVDFCIAGVGHSAEDAANLLAPITP